MKKGSIFSAVVMLVAFSACQEDDNSSNVNESMNLETVASLDMVSEETLEATFSDVDLIAESGLDILDISFNAGSREFQRKNRRDHALDCAVVTKDTVNKVMTIDFGDGCEGPHGEVRKGKMIITYVGKRNEAGSTRTVTLENYFVDSVGIEGTRTIENVTAKNDSMRTIRTTMTNGKITFADGTFATRTADHTKVMYRGGLEGEDYSTITGSANGTKRDGALYSATILEALKYKRGCGEIHVVIPVSGIKEVVNGDTTATFDYGDGTCDNEVSVTVDGVTTVETIEPKGRKMMKFKGRK
jgi:hypothetical protein